MITGLVRPDQGEVYLDDQEISQLPVYLRARLGINYLPQETSVFRKLTVGENIMAILETVETDKNRRTERLEELLAELDISALRRPAGRQPFRRSEEAPGNHSRPGDRPGFHPSGRAVCRTGSHRGLGDSKDHLQAQGTRNRRCHHRSQH